MLITTVVGSYPKISSDKTALNLRNSLNRFDKGELSEEDLKVIYDRVILRVVQEQEEIGIDVVTDGQIRWEDLFDGVSQSSCGCKRGSLVRFFDNNFYYRTPIVMSYMDRLQARDFEGYNRIVDDFIFLRKCSAVRVKAVVPGPMTFVALVEDKMFNNRLELMKDYSRFLCRLSRKLDRLGAFYIQLDEPIFGFDCEMVPYFEYLKSIEEIRGGMKARLFVHTYFGKFHHLWLGSLDIDGLGVDVVSDPKSLENLLDLDFRKIIVLGCIDARTTKMENEKEVVKIVGKVVEKFGKENVWLSPSCGLEFIPHDIVIKKLELLKRVAMIF